MTRFALTLLVAATLNAQAVRAQDFGNVRSGLLLGVYVSAANNGMRVTSTIPGYSAEGRLFPGDVLLRTTIDGQTIFNLRSLRELEYAKSAIGPNREAALEFFRPGEGVLYAWVEFTPLYGPAAVSRDGVKQFGAQFKMESEKPGARKMFQRGNSGSGLPKPPGQVVTPPTTLPTVPVPVKPLPGLKDPSRLFGR